MINSIIRNTETNELYRILYIFDSFVVLIKLQRETAKTFIKNLEDLNSNFETGYYEFVEDDNYIPIINEEDLSIREKEIRNDAYKIIEFINIEPDIYFAEKRRKIILEASKKFEVSERTIYKYLSRFWQGGKCKNALIPRFKNCGGRGKEKSNGIVKRGRKRIYALNNDEGINVDEEIKRIFRISIEKFYYNSKKNSLVTAYELMKKEYFSDENNNINPNCPTFGQFKYWFQKQRNIKEEVSKRYSSKKYYLNNRPLLYNSTQEAFGPGSIYQIDATIADVYLVSRFNKEWIIGRPVVYFVSDVFSRMITGMYVGLEGPSWVGAMMALVNSASDKVKYCREYGIEIQQEEWPCSHIPDSIIADRGEFEGSIAEGLINGLHVKIKNTPSFRADWKGIVEQFFRTINIKVKPFVDGFIDKDFKERGGKDYRLDAKLDLYTFTKIIIKCVLYHNNYHVLKNYDKSELMIKDNIECIPINLWNWGIKNCSGRLRKYSEEIVKLNVMPEDYATVTAKGIRFQGMYYACDKALKERWFEIARNKGTWKIRIKYDPRTVNYIYMIDENNRDFDKCYLLEYQEKFFNKTIDEVKQLYFVEKEKIKNIEKNLERRKMDLYDEIEKIISEQCVENISFNEKSKSERISNIRSNRLIEKQINRIEESFELKSNQNSVIFENNEEDEMDYLAIFKKKQEEKINGK